MNPEAIVVHIMDGSLSGTDAWFASQASEVSAHYGIGKAGEVHQYVEEADTAFHCGTVKNPSWPGLKRKRSTQSINPISTPSASSTKEPRAVIGPKQCTRPAPS